MNIVASDHALLRWRQRFSIYGDETIVDMRKALNEAITEQGEPPQGKSFYKRGNSSFVLQRKADLVTIVTAICDEPIKVNNTRPSFSLLKFDNPHKEREWLREQLKYWEGIAKYPGVKQILTTIRTRLAENKQLVKQQQYKSKSK